MVSPHTFGWFLTGSLMLALAAVGCGEDAHEATEGETVEVVEIFEEPAEPPSNRVEALAALEAVREAIARRSSAIDEAQADVDAARAELEATETRLEVARAALATDGRKLQQAQEIARRFATPDPVLFREVQRALLEAPVLEQVAIAAEVKEGVVTLRGSVPDEQTRTAAEGVARAVAGVMTVNNQVEVADQD